MTGFTSSPGKMRPGRGSQASRRVLQPSSHLPYVPSEGLTDPHPQPCRHDTYGVKSRAVFGTELGPQHQAAADWKEKRKKNKYMGRMLWNFGQGLWKSTSPKCVVTHLFHFPLPSECLQEDSDWRVYSAPLPSDDPASPSHCANWAVRFIFCARSRGGLMSDILFLCMLANPPVLNQWSDARLLFLTGHDIQHLFMFPFSFRDIIRKFWRCIVHYYQCCKQSAKHKYKEDMLLFILSSFISLNPFN